ncbi:Methanol oxidation protein [Labilithrix luteola]|uniref:Methanol oxidation protein n=1 Tax=Labilithrix luteola TaxID=1391654 RepID=A0A0K1PUB1_9BACT|nr:DUF4336 domain-containing protein [Labilithrix luteola]AKU97112.1 Methanol oxidation protein [Labilithrix luteola]
MTPLRAIGEGVWVFEAPLRFMGLVELGTRMTVLRIDDGVVVHSPAHMTPAVRTAVESIGPVRYVMAPNVFHHLFVREALEAWPTAKLVAPSALRKKRPDLHIDHVVDEGAPASWAGTLDMHTIHGSMLKETVLLHRPSRSVVSADLLENFATADDALTRAYLKLGGVYGKPGWHRLLRFVYRDRRAAKESIEKLLAEDFDRILIAHGDIVGARPHETVREALSFLLA